MFYAGIDWADKSMMGWCETARVKSRFYPGNPILAARLAKLDAGLSQMLGQQSQDQMACIIETTHGLLITFLLEHGWPVYPVNPRTVDRRRSASGAKTDAIDAFVLAKTGRVEARGLARALLDYMTSNDVLDRRAVSRFYAHRRARTYRLERQDSEPRLHLRGCDA